MNAYYCICNKKIFGAPTHKGWGVVKTFTRGLWLQVICHEQSKSAIYILLFAFREQKKRCRLTRKDKNNTKALIPL